MERLGLFSPVQLPLGAPPPWCPTLRTAMGRRDPHRERNGRDSLQYIARTPGPIHASALPPGQGPAAKQKLQQWACVASENRAAQGPFVPLLFCAKTEAGRSQGLYGLGVKAFVRGAGLSQYVSESKNSCSDHISRFRGRLFVTVINWDHGGRRDRSVEVAQYQGVITSAPARGRRASQKGFG